MAAGHVDPVKLANAVANLEGGNVADPEVLQDLLEDVADKVNSNYDVAIQQENGTWTPELVGSLSGNLNTTLAEGSYVRMRNVILLNFRTILASPIGTVSGGIGIRVPITPNSNNIVLTGFASNKQISYAINPYSSRNFFELKKNDGNAIVGSDLAGGDWIYGSLIYKV